MLDDYTAQLVGFTIGMVKQTILDRMVQIASNIPAEYQIRIISNRGECVIAKMQENFTLSVDSKWEPFIDGASIAKALSGVASYFGTSLQLAVTSRRIWLGTSPVSITLPMVFMAESNAKEEVVDQVRMLQKMALPGTGTGGFLTPPGPGQYYASVGGKDVNLSFTKSGTEITLTIGRVLTFKKVIIKSVSVEHGTQMSESPRGLPISAKATVEFQTYEILTRDGIDAAYSGANVSKVTG